MSELPLDLWSLVDEVSDTARGYTHGTDQVTSLVTDMDESTVGFSVADGSVMSVGLVEIGDELMQVRLVRADDGYCETEPWGRGVNGSDVHLHFVGDRVVVNPLYPRARIKSALAATLREIFPDVYPVGTINLDSDVVTVGYVLSPDVWQVLNVSALQIGPGNVYLPVRRWSCDQTNQGTLLSVYSALPPGPGRLRVQYIRTPPTDFTDSVELTDYGYEPSVRDLLVMGATAKLLAFTEPSRVAVDSVESAARGVVVPAGSAVNLARMLYQMFQKRVDDERRQLLFHYPPQVHQVR